MTPREAADVLTEALPWKLWQVAGEENELIRAARLVLGCARTDGAAASQAGTGRDAFLDAVRSHSGRAVTVGAWGSDATAEGRLVARASDVNPLVVLDGPWPCEKLHGPVSTPAQVATPPEVVTGEEAMNLPPGSVISQWVGGRPVDALTHYTGVGWRRSGCTDNRPYGEQLGGTGSEYVVWYRHLPALAVGDTVETKAQLEALKPGTHLAGTKSAVGATRSLNGWLVTGVSNADAHGLVELNLPNWRVVALPEGGAA